MTELTFVAPPGQPMRSFNADDARRVARELTPGQRSTIKGLDDEFCMLGCAEDCARRLAVHKSNRPSLTRMRRTDDGPLFALTPAGFMVKEQL